MVGRDGDDGRMQQSHEEFARNVIRSLVPAWRDQPLDVLHWLPGGYSNRNWRFRVDRRDYAVRVVARPGPRQEEAKYLALPSAPDVVAFDESAGHLITEWIDAPTLAEEPSAGGSARGLPSKEEPVPAEEAGLRIARLQAEIPAGVRRYDVRQVIEEHFLAARDAGHLDARAVEALERLSWQPSRLAGCHNDLNPWNILCTPLGWRTLDWEYAGDNDPLFDVVGFCTCLGWDRDATRSCVHAWGEACGMVPPSTGHMHRTLAAFHLREYAWAVAQLAQGNDRPEIRQQAADHLTML